MKQLLLCFLCACSLASCNNDEPENGLLLGEWNLDRIIAFAPTEEFQTGENVWTFDTTNMTVTIEATKEITTYDLPAGTYNYVMDNDIFEFTSGNVTWERFIYIEDGNSLVLDAGSVTDAPRLEFSK